MSGQLEGRVAIVTGASRGIGKAIALLFAREGAKVVVAARTQQAGEHPLPGTIAETAAEIAAAGGAAPSTGSGQALAVRCDVSDPEDVARLVEETHRAFGPVDVLVNNAALNYYIPLAEFPLKRWRKMLEVDLTGPFMLVQAVLPDMLAAGRGHIVNISSRAARHPEPPYAMEPRGGTPYGVVKAGLERLTTGLAHELHGTGVAVNALSPTAVVPTPGVLFHRLIESEDDPRAEPVEYMARAALLLATCAPDFSGRITYSQSLLTERGLL
ncbi:MAG TPA: SDR family NAD(P)-dependent oxidoreductase [Dehalococcoidia bacterium]|nr:SDR family NAD(P)-dependent oxidoreductase [Dehalococcoidia bacterium]